LLLSCCHCRCHRSNHHHLLFPLSSLSLF
jgi:hypothetical protein